MFPGHPVSSHSGGINLGAGSLRISQREMNTSFPFMRCSVWAQCPLEQNSFLGMGTDRCVPAVGTIPGPVLMSDI